MHECLRLGTDVDCRDSLGRTPLCIALAEVAKEYQCRSGRSPGAAQLKQLRRIAKVLLEQHADPGSPADPRLAATDDSFLPVTCAWYSLDVELVELFAQHGV